MISLLRRLEEDDRRHALPPDPFRDESLRRLEWDRVLADIAARCRTAAGAAALCARVPLTDAAAVARRHALHDQLRRARDRHGEPPQPRIDDLLTLLDRPRPLRLEGEELLAVASAARDLAALREWFLAREDDAPLWADAAAEMADPAPVADRIGAVLDRDGRLRDDASATLARLRRSARRVEQQARRAAGDALEKARRAGWTTGDTVVLRGDRFCLPVRSGALRRVAGIVHDRSAGGATLFVEPAAVVPLLNELAALRADQRAEEQRLLLELNAAVEAAAPDLREAARLAVLLDACRAALLWSRDVDGVRPELAPGGPLILRGARHPLLLAAGREVVPLDLAPPPERRVVVISGPNAGGKTVALKTVGLCCLLAQCGWDVPAAPGTRLPLLRRVAVELGDDQSLARSLSSFSAHLTHLAEFLAAAGADTLVLVDEMGAGTDPAEGAALAFALLEAFAGRGSTVLATTHDGSLKAAVADDPRMLNAAMEFDEAALRPRFTLRLGVPGASHAFAIASRLALPEAVLARARSLVGEDRFAVERLLTELADLRRRLADEAERQRRLREELARREGELAGRLARLDAERQEILEQARREGERFLAEARRTVEGVVRELRSSGADRTVIRRGREKLQQLADRLPAAPAADAGDAPRVAAGQRVRVPHLDSTGRVVECRGGRVVVVSRGWRLTLPLAAVEPLPGEGEPATAGSGDDGDRPGRRRPGRRSSNGALAAAAVTPPPLSIDLRGRRVEEAWEELDRLIDRAIPSGTARLEVVHGWGTGRLREALWERLRADPRVASIREAPPDRGGHGCTIVELAD